MKENFETAELTKTQIENHFSSFANRNFLGWLISKNEAGEKTISLVVLLIELFLVYVSTTESNSILITLAVNLVFLGYFIFKFNRQYRLPFATRNFEQLSEFKILPTLNKFKFWKYEKRANESILQFRVFEQFLYSTAILYLIIIVVKLQEIFFEHESKYPHIINFRIWFDYITSLFIHLFSYCGAIYILKCFYIMYFPTFSDLEIQKKLKVIYYFWFGMVLLLTVEAILTLPINEMNHNIPLNTFYFEFLCSIVSGVALMLLFARFESRLLGIHPAVTLVLYIYAILQVALPFVTESITKIFFDNNDKVKLNLSYKYFVTIILVICLIGKLVFFNIVVYLYKTKRLFYYFIKTAISYEKEDDYWYEFQKDTKHDNRII